MNIVINALSAKGGGGQTYLTNILRHLDEGSGLRVWIMAPDSLEIPKKSNIERVHVRWPTNSPFLRIFWERWRLPSLLKSLSADVLFCPGGLINTTPPLGCKKAITFQNMMPFDSVEKARYPRLRSRLKYWLLEKMFTKSFIDSDLVIFISEHAKKTVQSLFRGRLSRTVMIPHGLSDQFSKKIESGASRPGFVPEGDYLLYVSEFRGDYKNHVELVRGYSLLKQMRDTPEKLLLVGEHSSVYGRRVKVEIDKLGLNDEVILMGNIPHESLPGTYGHAKVNVFASSCENCSNVLLEMLGSGRPLLSSNVQPMPEFAGDGALYYDPFSPEDFAVKMKEILDDDATRSRMAEMAADRALAYDWQDVSARVWAEISAL